MGRFSTRPSPEGSRIARRSLLRAGILAGLASASASLLAACQQPSAAPSPPSGGAQQPAPTSAPQQSAATPAVGTKQQGPATAGGAKGKVVIVLSVEPNTLENWKAYSTDGHPVLRNVQEALLNRDPVTNELVPELATSWEQVNPTTWRFKLREGVKFHNGDALDAEAAAFGLNYTWSPENNFEIMSYIGPQLKAKAVDKYTLDVETEQPDPILPSRLYFSPLPSPTQVQNDPKSLPTKPIGTGPYKFVEWVKGQRIVITANPDWWGHGHPDARGKVTIQDAEYVFRAESAVRASMVTAGEAHFARFLSPEECAKMPQCVRAPSVETIFLRLDTMHPAMKDLRVRKAIAFAIDKQGVADKLFGSGVPASQLVGPSATGYNPDLKPYPYDLEEAKRLVAEAKAAGVPVDAPITCATRKGIYLRHDEFAEYTANQLRTIGLNAKSEVIEPAQFNEQYTTPQKDIPPTRGWITNNPHGNEIMDVSATAQSYYRCEGAASTYCDPELDKALAAALPLVGEERVKALQAVTKMFYDAYAAVPVIHMELHFGLSQNLAWKPRLDGFMLLKEMELKA
ncbi:MAG TPA: ABC transporter substrate-binding protein [Chloroflexota bacterium]